jgi:hypothetical protein
MSLAIDAWDEISDKVEKLYVIIRKLSSINVNSTKLRADTKEIVQNYFLTARPSIATLGISDNDLAITDEILQSLNAIAQGNNRKKTYIELLRALREQLVQVGLRRHVMAGKKNEQSSQLTSQQTKIVLTLKEMVPSAAFSFEQALFDLTDLNRLSYRGTAAELREVIRETIDHLAPDEAVSSVTGFQFEKDFNGKLRTSPTMKQKVRFILKSRGKSTNAVANAQDALQQLEVGPENLARSVYNRGSAATHTAQARKEIIALQRYTEVLLADLLETE